MTKLDAKAAVTAERITTQNAPAPARQDTETAALITERQVLLSSAAALAPAPARRRSVVDEMAAAVRGLFARPEKPRAIKHYPQRFSYLEYSAMSREMGRL